MNTEEKSDEIKKYNLPGGLKILSILSMIGSVFIGLIMLTLAGQQRVDFILFLYICLTAAFVLKFIGALKMFKGKKSGYKIYMIPNVIINILLILSIIRGDQTDQIEGAIILSLSMIMFAVFFYTFKENLK